MSLLSSYVSVALAELTNHICTTAFYNKPLLCPPNIPFPCQSQMLIIIFQTCDKLSSPIDMNFKPDYAA